MRKILKFLLIEITIFAIMGLITSIEITNFNIFESFFTLIKTPSSWFVGLSLAYAFSNLFKKGLLSIFAKRRKKEEREKGDFFVGFLITLIITSLITPYIKDGAMFFFTNYFVYFHLILMQSVIILYLFFKLEDEYEISGKYLLTNELIVLFYTGVVLSFIA